MSVAVKKAVMYNIWYQDGAGNYIETYHPDVTLLVSYYFSGTWDYGSQRYTDGFAKNYLHNGHGPLAALYPQDYISEGDSPAFLYSLVADYVVMKTLLTVVGADSSIK